MPNTDMPWQTESDFCFYNADHQAWLCDRGSLTAALRQHHGTIAVEVVQQGQSQPRDWEAQALTLTEKQPCWLRQVHLSHQTHKLIAARTVIPYFDSDNPWYALSTLGNQPLGERLFSIPELQRTAFEFTYIQDTQTRARYPARRCLFYHHQHALLLSEAFLFLALSPADYESFMEKLSKHMPNL